jgi:hypothetical protein
MRSGFDGVFTEVVQNEVLASYGAWDGIPGQTGPWQSNLRVELTDQGDTTRLVVREGPHPPRRRRSGPGRPRRAGSDYRLVGRADQTG